MFVFVRTSNSRRINPKVQANWGYYQVLVIFPKGSVISPIFSSHFSPRRAAGSASFGQAKRTWQHYQRVVHAWFRSLWATLAARGSQGQPSRNPSEDHPQKHQNLMKTFLDEWLAVFLNVQNLWYEDLWRDILWLSPVWGCCTLSFRPSCTVSFTRFWWGPQVVHWSQHLFFWGRRNGTICKNSTWSGDKWTILCTQRAWFMSYIWPLWLHSSPLKYGHMGCFLGCLGSKCLCTNEARTPGGPLSVHRLSTSLRISDNMTNWVQMHMWSWKHGRKKTKQSKKEQNQMKTLKTKTLNKKNKLNTWKK